MYSIKEFSAMTGLPQSKIRFYERQGLLSPQRGENGYRMFTPMDAFRSNAFRVLLQYGFSLEQASAMLDAEQSTEEFKQSLSIQKESLQREVDFIRYRLDKITSALELIEDENRNDFALLDVCDQLYTNASNGYDFSVSLENERTIKEFYNLLSITSCARIIKKDDFESKEETINPSYIITMPEYESYRLSEESLKQVKRLKLGKCIRLRRELTRTESVKRETFDELFAYMKDHGYRMRNDIILFPMFLNLDGEGSDIETLYVPID